MNWWQILLLTLGILIFAFLILQPFLASYFIYHNVFVRTKPSKFSYESSAPKNKMHTDMHNEGFSYFEETKEKQKVLSLISKDGLRLVAFYLDFGYKRTVIIVPGRGETSRYSAFYAKGYKDQGWNVLLHDSRATGKSEGKRISVGVYESEDLLLWAKKLHDEEGQEIIVLHGVCVGGAASILALNNPNCPTYLKGGLAEAPYQTFLDITRTHTRAIHMPPFPAVNIMPIWPYFMLKINLRKNNPLNAVSKMSKPILFLQSKEDIFVPYQKTEELYDLCSSKKKAIHFFEHGVHSHLRYQYQKEYDQTVLEWMNSIADESPI